MKRKTLSDCLPHAVWCWVKENHPEHIDNFTLITESAISRMHFLARRSKTNQPPINADEFCRLYPSKHSDIRHLEDGYLDLVTIEDRHRMRGIQLTARGIAFTEVVNAAMRWYRENHPTEQK